MADICDHSAGGVPRALLLDSDRTSRAAIIGVLEASGWRAEARGADPESVRARGLPDVRVVIADWPRLEPLWPDLLSARESGNGTPHLIALVDAGADNDARAALVAGADDCLARPVRAADVATRLGVARRSASGRRAGRAAIVAARLERDRLASVLSSLPDGLVILAPDRTVIEVNEVFCAMTGVDRAAHLGRRSLFPDWPEEERPRLAAALAESERGGVSERDVVLPRADGGRFPAIVRMAPARGADGAATAFVVTVKDVGDRVRAERVRASLRRVSALAAAGIETATVLDRIAAELGALAGGGLVLRGEGSEAAVVASSPGLSPDGPPAGVVARDAAIMVADVVWGAVAAAPAPGVRLPEGLDEVLQAFAETAAAALVAERARALPAGRAATDPVTGLPDAQAFSALMGREFERARRERRPVALVLVDIDGFRRVNDAHGQAAGDRVLRELAERLRAHVRAGDRLGRTGGDEFAWLLPDTDERAAHDAAARLRRTLAERQFTGGGRLTVSVGIASGGSADGAADLHRRAEVALHWAKVSGRNRAVAYSFAVAEEVFARRGDDRAETPSLRAMRALAWAVDAKDPHTHLHSTRVADLAVRLATALGWPVARAAQLREAGLVHDVGKIAVPDAVLFKPGPLTASEREDVCRHPAVGAAIVADVLSPEQAAWVRSHHERWDGAGYPDRLAGEDIPEEARVLALADAWDVMVSSRSYKPRLPLDEALAEVRRHCGTQFWPPAVEALERLVAAGAVTVPDEAQAVATGPAGARATPAPQRVVVA